MGLAEVKRPATKQPFHSRCTMTDHDMLPVAAEAGADMKRLALQIHENTISCAAIAGYQLYARALQIHV